MVSEHIDNVLIEVLRDFTSDWGLDVEISRQTRLVGDLEFDSIDIIQVVVAIEGALGARNLGFQELLMVDGRYVDDLSIAQIGAFLKARSPRPDRPVSSSRPASPAMGADDEVVATW